MYSMEIVTSYRFSCFLLFEFYRATERCFTKTLLILAAQSADIALFIACSAPTVQLLEDVVLEAFPVEGRLEIPI